MFGDFLAEAKYRRISSQSSSSSQPTHKECANFTWEYGGYCTLKNKNVEPEGPACPDFQPKHASSSSLNQMDIFHLALGACFIAAGTLIIGHFVLKWF
jgi:hypothetical protein